MDVITLKKIYIFKKFKKGRYFTDIWSYKVPLSGKYQQCFDPSYIWIDTLK